MTSGDWKDNVDGLAKNIRVWFLGQSDYRVGAMIFGAGLGLGVGSNLWSAIGFMIMGWGAAFLYEKFRDDSGK